MPSSCTRNDDPFDVVAGVRFPVLQALAVGVEPLIAGMMRASMSDELQILVVEQAWGLGGLARPVGPGQV